MFLLLTLLTDVTLGSYWIVSNTVKGIYYLANKSYSHFRETKPAITLETQQKQIEELQEKIKELQKKDIK